jgi:hypothetical protein
MNRVLIGLGTVIFVVIPTLVLLNALIMVITGVNLLEIYVHPLFIGDDVI